MPPLERVKLLFATAITEDKYRNVASRAYFTAFNAATAFAARRGFSSQGTWEDHTTLIEFLKCEKIEELLKIGRHRLPRLRVMAYRADYVKWVEFTREMAKETMLDCAEVISWLGQVDLRTLSE